jgi:hypothetical protein
MRLFKTNSPAGVATTALLLAPLAASVIWGWVCRIGRVQSCDGYAPGLLAIAVRDLLDGVPLYREFGLGNYMTMVYHPGAIYLAAPLVRLFGSNSIAPLEAGRL